VECGHVGHTGELARIEPDVQVQTERLRHLVAEEGTEGATVDAPNQLSEEITLGLGVVPVRVARSPARRLRGQ